MRRERADAIKDGGFFLISFVRGRHGPRTSRTSRPVGRAKQTLAEVMANIRQDKSESGRRD